VTPSSRDLDKGVDTPKRRRRRRRRSSFVGRVVSTTFGGRFDRRGAADDAAAHFVEQGEDIVVPSDGVHGACEVVN
jgi:hypothetical protein